MRFPLFLAALALAACTTPPAQNVVSTTLVSADAATSLAVGERLSEQTTEIGASEGNDPVVNLVLRHPDGRTLAFQEGNHAPNDLFVQSAGGALAQIMGLTGNETPLLFHAASGEGASGAPIFCGPQGPAAIGRYEAPDGSVRIVGLKQEIQVEMRPDGQNEAVPFSPDQVCARLNFHKG